MFKQPEFVFPTTSVIGLRNLLTGESATLRDAEPTRFELDDGTFTFSGNVVVTKGPFPFARMRGSGIREQFGFPGRRGGATVSSVRLA